MSAIARGFHGVKGRLHGDCEEARKGGKLSAGAGKGGQAGKGKKKASPPSEAQKLRIVVEVNEWRGLKSYIEGYKLGRDKTGQITKMIMSFLYGEQSRSDEMFDGLDTTVAPYKVAFMRYIERNLNVRDRKYNSNALAISYADNTALQAGLLIFKADKVKTFARNIKKAFKIPLIIPAWKARVAMGDRRSIGTGRK